jgi:hypothetical protein
MVVPRLLGIADFPEGSAVIDRNGATLGAPSCGRGDRFDAVLVLVAGSHWREASPAGITLRLGLACTQWVDTGRPLRGDFVGASRALVDSVGSMSRASNAKERP